MRLFMAWVVVLIAQTAGFAATPPKVAVLGGETTGWNDLLVTRLSETNAVATVERQQLGAVFDEQAIQGLFGNDAGRGRMDGIAGADLLVLLVGSENNVRLAVCDSHLGVRLQELSLSVDDTTRDQVVAALAEETLRIVEQFKDGVKDVVAVPDFVSHDLTFEYSFLQSDYAEVLRAAYQQIPGVALVAVDEAKAIGTERGVTGGEQSDRPVPVFIEGEYRSERNLEDGGTSVEITVRARNAANVLLERKLEAVPFDKAGEQLATLFADELAGLVRTGRPTIGVDDQFRLLTRRAEEFSSLGEFRRSAALREAAILLKPDADDQRIQLVREYTRHNRQPVELGDWPKGARNDEEDPFWTSLVTEVVSDWKRSLQHCEYLIRNRRLCREEATDLTYNAIDSLTGVRRGAVSAPLLECEAIKKDFLRHSFSRIALLDPASQAERLGLTGSLDVYSFLFACALMRCDGNYHDEEDLDLITDLLLNRLPESMWPVSRLDYFLHDAGTGLSVKSSYYRFSEKEYLTFLDRLMASERPLVRIYGRYGMLCYRYYGKQEKSWELVEEAEDLRADAEKANSNLLRQQTGYERYMYDSDRLRSELRRFVSKLASEAPTKEHPAAPTPPRSDTKPGSRISLEAIAGTEHDGRRLSQFHPLGQGLDAFSSPGAVLFMNEPGKMIPVLSGEGMLVDDVITDGRYVWIVTSYKAVSYRRGLSVFDRDGNKLAPIGEEQGLPPCDRFGMVVHPLAQGRVLAVGSFGNEHRAWIAIVEFNGNQSKVEVIHEATNVWYPNSNDESKAADPDMAFIPETVFEHVIPASKPRRIIFITRRASLAMGRRSPLLVDPDTREVWAYPTSGSYRESFPPGDTFLSIDGTLWIAASWFLLPCRFNEESGRLQVLRDNRNNWQTGVHVGSLARHGDWLYYTGEDWRRINLHSGKEELLVDGIDCLPKFARSGVWHIASSSHYGLVGFNKGTLYRIRIDGTAPAAGS